jgi:hypothetical protein
MLVPVGQGATFSSASVASARRRRERSKLSAVQRRHASEQGSYLVDSASSHMLVSKIKPCTSKYKHLYGETANGSLYHS